VSEFSWFIFCALYIVGIFVTFALIISRIQDKIRAYQRRVGDDSEYPPEMGYCMLACVWPVVLFGIIPSMILLMIVKFFYHLGMGEIDFRSPVRLVRGRFWQVRARIAREDG
jgi:hypothetical protein